MILMLNGSRNWGGQPDTFLMHTYKIYFRLYLLLLPLCLCEAIWKVKMEIFLLRLAEKNQPNCLLNPSKITNSFSYHKQKYLTSFRSSLSIHAKPFNEWHRIRELLLCLCVFSLGGFCVIKYILKNLLNYPLTSSSTELRTG
jgi:hypothetical protein